MATEEPKETEALAEGAETPQEVKPQEPLEKFSLPVLKIIMEAQGLHGLRYGDYQRYRQYCSRRMRRLRKGLNFLHWEQGKGKSRFAAKNITVEVAVDIRFLLIVMNKAERAWAYAMQLREAPDGPGREAHHVQRLLAKAVKHAALLEELCAGRADDRSALEAEAYTCWVNGNMCLEREQWDTALAKLQRCRTVYDELSQAAAAGDEQGLYKKRVEEIDPTIRYCKYNVSRHGGATDLEEKELLEIGKTSSGNEMLKAKLERSLAQTRKEKAEAVGSVEWLGAAVSVDNATTHQHILTADGSKAELASAETFEQKMQTYDKIFMALEDAKRLIREDISDHLKVGEGCDEAAVQQLQTLRSFVQSKVLLFTRDRDLLLVDNVHDKIRAKDLAGRKAPRPENLVKMFEQLLASNEEWAALPGIADAPDLTKLSAARALMFKAWRILHLAQSYKLQKQLPEALALVERVQQLTKVAAQRFSQTSAADDIDKVWLQKLQDHVRLNKVEVKAEAVLQQAAGPAHPTSGQGADTLKQLAATPLSARLNNYEAAVYGDAGKLPRLVDFPPPIEAVACKPVLFDLALNKAFYPDVSARATKKKSGGILGWFGR